MRIDTERFDRLVAVKTDGPDHYSIRPPDDQELEEWIKSRDEEPESQDDWHPLTRELYEAVVDTEAQESY